MKHFTSLQFIYKPLMKRFFIFSFCIFFILFLSCKPKKEIVQEPVNDKTVPTVAVKKPVITYHLMALNMESVQKINGTVSSDSLDILNALNRTDKYNLLKLDTLIIPNNFIAGLNNYSPFPLLVKDLEPIHKIIFISYLAQSFAAYEAGVLIRSGPVSMGKENTPTPIGLFFTNWKSKKAISLENSDWIMNWYFNIDNVRGISIHEANLPGYPASHACIRLISEDAFWFYNWAEQYQLISTTEVGAYGTPVILFDVYPFGQRKPWLSLSENPLALNISEEMLMGKAKEYLPLIQQRQLQRDTVIVKNKTI